MGSITSILSSFTTQTVSQQPTLAATAPGNGIQAFGQAFQISLTQQQNADGSDTDNVSFEAYSASGNTASCTFGEGSGDSAESAFEAMLANFSAGNSAGNSSTGGNVGVTGAVGSLSNIFDQMVSSLGTSSGTVGVAEGGLLTVANSPNLAGEFGAGAVSNFVNSVITSLENSLDNLGSSSGNTSAANTSTTNTAATQTANTTGSNNSTGTGSGTGSQGNTPTT